ncbi:hypothetical protein P9139_11195 [Curtobacterium flaccumfaciens]|nr:hypothetical protein P9139_11195 [Curtobacterium flaccumfaciens]
MSRKTITISTLALALTVGGAVVAAPPASADTADTSVTAEVASGALSISAPEALDFGAITRARPATPRSKVSPSRTSARGPPVGR